MELHSSR